MSSDCPGKDRCPYRSVIHLPRQALALSIVLVMLGGSWWLVVKIERRAPTIFEVSFAVSAVIGLLLQPIELLAILRDFFQRQ